MILLAIPLITLFLTSYTIRTYEAQEPREIDWEVEWVRIHREEIQEQVTTAEEKIKKLEDQLEELTENREGKILTIEQRNQLKIYREAKAEVFGQHNIIQTRRASWGRGAF